MKHHPILRLILPLLLLLLVSWPFTTHLIKAQSEPPDEHSSLGPGVPAEVVASDRLKAPDLPQFMASQVTLSVPAYYWRHGCGPTALGMLVGYYDGRGYSDLVPGSAAAQNDAVNQVIASGGNSASPFPPGSEQHYEDYARPQDYSPTMKTDDVISKKRTPHTDNSLADFMDTSKSTRDLYYGWSWGGDMGPAFVDYVNRINPSYKPAYQRTYTSNGSLTWGLLVTEINAGRPMIFLVDSNADGSTDHFVTVVGYRDSPSRQYGMWDTWNTSTIRWENFQAMSKNTPWGVWGGWSFTLSGLNATPTLNNSITPSPAATRTLVPTTTPTPTIPGAADSLPPQVSWLKPVENEQAWISYDQWVTLAVQATDNTAVARVQIDWWDAVQKIWRVVLTDDSAPYGITLNPATLNYGWNQLNAVAVDAAGNASAAATIWIYRAQRFYNYFPIMLP